MEKSIHTEDHQRLATLLRALRTEAGLTQEEVARELQEPQSFVSKYETGERRLDLVELRQVSEALGADVVKVVRRWNDERASAAPT